MQKIKTYYEPSTTAYKRSDEDILDAHMDRRGLNRLKRAEQSGFAGKVKGAALNALGRAKSFAENHPINHEPRERHERNTRHERHESPAQERAEHRGGKRVSRVDRYEDGKVKETIYFSTNESIPKRKKVSKPHAPRRSRESPGIGSGLDMSAFIPQGMGMPFGKRSNNDDWMNPGYIPPHLKKFF